LFESAAQVYAPHLLGIVLTGANDDGAAGCEMIRNLGGAIAVQDPATALAAEMPRAAIQRARPQWVGAVHEVPSMMILASGGAP